MSRVYAKTTLLRQDPLLLGRDGKPAVDVRQLILPPDAVDRFLDGPVTRRIAVVDLDPATGAPVTTRPRFQPNRTGPSGTYVADGEGHDTPGAIAINAFGIVFDTLRMVEERGSLGRPLRWGFGREQIVVVPRASEERNAFYDPRSGSLQFGWFAVDGGRIVHTALSRDIVAHETGHAILDAIAPSLRSSLTLDGLAIHEAVADLIALLMALRNRALRDAVLSGTEQPLRRSNAFSAIAQELGQAVQGPGRAPMQALRNLENDATVSSVEGEGAHVRSTVLSGMVYAIFVDLYDWFLTKAVEQQEQPNARQAARQALGSAEAVLRRVLLRGLDYLPPGEVVFADVGRAILAADRAVPRDAGADDVRAMVEDHIVRRGIATAADLRPPKLPMLAGVPDLELLRDSDRAAYLFVEANRRRLGIPAGASFDILARLDATKQVRTRDDPDTLQRELIMKVMWRVEEDQRVPGWGVQTRRIPTGCTLVWRWGERQELVALVKGVATRRAHAHARDRHITHLVEEGAIGPPGQGAAVQAIVVDGVVEMRGTLGLLHQWGEDR